MRGGEGKPMIGEIEQEREADSVERDRGERTRNRQ